MNEHLTQAMQSISSARSSLLKALNESTSVEVLLIMDNLDRASELQKRVEQLLNARIADESGEE